MHALLLSMETNNTRAPYSVPQLRACLAVANVRYNRATTCAECAEWLRAIHKLRDRVAFTEFMESMK